MIPKRLRENPPPCVYCGLDSITWTQVPAHILCPECQVSNPGDAFHVITVNRPVCLAHHPHPAEVRLEIEYKQAEKEREERTEAKRAILEFIGHLPDAVFQTTKTEHSEKAIADAIKEIREGNFDLY